MTVLAATQVLEKLADGWQLGKSTIIIGRVWMERELCFGGDFYLVSESTLEQLLDQKKLVLLPRQKYDSDWMRRYGLPKE